MDVRCRCNNEQGFAYVTKPKDVCACIPSEEDCSCYRCTSSQTGAQCGHYDMTKCVPVKDSGEKTENVINKSVLSDSILSTVLVVRIVVLVAIVILVIAVIILVYLMNLVPIVHFHPKDTVLANIRQEPKTDETLNKDVNELQVTEKTFEKDNPSKMTVQEMTERLQRGELEKVNFGIAGESAAGKSSFINLLLDLKEGDDNYAKVGFGNTTTEPKTYHHRASDHFTITDMPGISAIMPRSRFLQMVDLSDYQFFFIFFKDVLSETDVWIAEELTNRNIPFGLVRAKLDEYVLSQKERKIGEEDAIEMLRKRLSETNGEISIFKNAQLYLISNIKKYFHIGDFVNLVVFIQSTLSDAKAEAFLHFLPVLTPKIIDLKFRSLLRRVAIAYTLSGAVAAVPLPLVDIPVSIGIVTKEIRHYVKAFQLDQEYAKKVPNLKHGIFRARGSRRQALEIIAKQSLASLAQIGLTMAISQLDVFIPVIGSVLSACGNTALIGSCLLSNLKELRDDALMVNEYYRNPS